MEDQSPGVIEIVLIQHRCLSTSGMPCGYGRMVFMLRAVGCEQETRVCILTAANKHHVQVIWLMCRLSCTVTSWDCLYGTLALPGV